MEAIEQNIQQKIRDNGLKVTKSRVMVLKYLMSTTTHPSVDMVLDYLIGNGEEISLATVYNILDTFYDKGMILKMMDKDNVMRFDANTDVHLHICDKETNEIVDFFDPELERVINKKVKKIKKAYTDKDISNVTLMIQV